MQFTSNSVNDTYSCAARIASSLKTNLLCLYGELGSGKTTFVQGLAKALGIKKRLISPTFIIIRQYQINNYQQLAINNQQLIHIDCYRLNSPADARVFDFKELWDNKKNLVVIEWADKIQPILPKNRIEIKFTYIDEKKRKIELILVNWT